MDVEGFENLRIDVLNLKAQAPERIRLSVHNVLLLLERVPGGVSSVPELNAFGPVAWQQPVAAGATAQFSAEHTIRYPTDVELIERQ